MGKGCLDVEQNDLFLGGGMLSENEESDQPSPLAAKLSRLLEAHGHGVTVGAGPARRNFSSRAGLESA